MNTIEPTFNWSPCCTDWRRYDSPTVLRRLGRDFLERSWTPGCTVKNPATLSPTEVHRLVANYGGLCLTATDHLLLIFDDYHWARRCEDQLIKLGLSTQRWGCHIQLHGSW